MDCGAFLAKLAPQPGHAPAAVDQHRSQAKTPQDLHIRSSTRRSVDAAPTRFPHRSQYGRGAPPEGGDDFGTRIVERVEGVEGDDDPLASPGIRKVGPVASGDRGSCAADRAAEGSSFRPDITGVGQAPEPG